MPDQERSSSPYITADAVLLGVSVFWGTSFAIVKEVLAETTPANLLFLRFGFACLLLLPIAWSRRRTWSGKFLKPGAIAGLFLFTAFLTQAWGLIYTSASRSGFITGLSVILVPLLSVVLWRRMPPRAVSLGAAMALAGLYFLTSVDQAQALPFNLGDLLTLVCAVLWAGHILALGRYSPDADFFWLTFLQLAVSLAGSFAWVSLSGELSLALSPSVYLAALYLAVTCTLIAYLGQTWAQALTAPARTAIILSMEPVFAAVFAWIWLNERMGPWGWIGAGLILGGIFLAELRTKF